MLTVDLRGSISRERRHPLFGCVDVRLHKTPSSKRECVTPPECVGCGIVQATGLPNPANVMAMKTGMEIVVSRFKKTLPIVAQM